MTCFAECVEYFLKGKYRDRHETVERDGRAIQVEISDDGPGISTEDLPYVFDPFQQQKKGDGPGLSNVNRIIEAHGGTGACRPKAPWKPRSVSPFRMREMTLKSQKNLIIDDERPLLETLEMFSRRRLRVMCALSASEGTINATSSILMSSSRYSLQIMTVWMCPRTDFARRKKRIHYHYAFA